MLGLGSSLLKGGLTTPGIVTDSLVLKHNYAAGGVVPVSDGAAFFDGTDDYIDCGSSSGLKAIANSSFTLSAWIKPALDGSNDVIIGNTWSTKGFYFTIHSSNKLQFTILTDGSNLVSTLSTNVLSAGWTHVAGTWDGTNIKTFVNGAESTNMTSSGTLGSNTSTTNFYIGDNSESSNPFNGYICNVGLWSTALTQAQIKSIMWKNYAGLTSSETTGLVSWWNLDEAVGDNSTHVVDSVDTSLGSEVFTDGNMELSGITNWSATTTSAATKTKDTSNPYAGSNSLKTLREGGAGGFAQEVTLVVGTTYKYTGYVYISSSTWLPAWDTDENIGVGGTYGVLISTTGEWVSFTEYFTATATTMYVGGWKYDPDTYALVDNLSLKPVGGNYGILT